MQTVHQMVMDLICHNGGHNWQKATRSQIASRLRFWRSHKRPDAKGRAVIANSIFPRVI